MHGFLPVPSRRLRYYCTSSSSFPGPYSVPPGVSSVTLQKASEVEKHSVLSLPWRPCFRVYAWSPPGWSGGYLLVEVSGSIFQSRFVPTLNGRCALGQEP